MKNNLNNLKDFDRTYFLRRFVILCRKDKQLIEIKSLKEFENSKVIYKKLPLINDMKENGFLSKEIENIINALVRGLEEDFDYNDVSIFSQFDPNSFPDNPEFIDRFGVEENLSIMRILNIREQDTPVFYVDFIRGLLSLNDFTSLKCQTSQTFWAELLRRKNAILNKNIRRMIRFALSIPLSNAICERGFSIMGSIKDYDQNRLSASGRRVMNLH